MSRTSEIRQMSISVRPSIDPAEIGSSPARGTHGTRGALGLPGTPAAVAAAPAPAARRHGA
ncbi:hypothetical protein [Streptomyces venezuelae]|uniref:hypothetical protein n=1 Tax=Streptomyces venezuelae TaxID=54571 RepID=UPI001239FEDA|nr:hypothetical protein [Streptomyces venezuelae]